MTPFKERRTAEAVYFVTGPGSNWFPAAFEQNLPDGTPLALNCGEQGMMAHKAWHFGDMAALERILAIGPKDMAATLAAMERSPVEALQAFNAYPRQQKAAGRDVRPFDEAEWERVAEEYVFSVSLARFCQNPAQRAWLLGTGDRLLVEGSSKDRIWGVGIAWDDDRILDSRNWLGRNKLGRVHMRVREWIARSSEVLDLLGEAA